MGLTGQTKMNSKCVFWNKILPAFLPERIDIKDEVIQDIEESHDSEEDYYIQQSDDYEEPVIDDLPLGTFIEIERIGKALHD